MLVPISWIKEYVDIDVNLEEFAERMIMSGSNIETVKLFGTEDQISGVVVGRVISAVPHPDSDHLKVCKVDVADASEGGEQLQIVCGAPNVREGLLVPVALHGSILPGGVKIKKGKLRGEVSEGMICGADELGFDDKVVPFKSKDGIWELPDDLTVGESLVSALGLDEAVIDFEITPNRPDCLSIIGMAREAAATLGTSLKYPDTSVIGEDESDTASSHVEVVISDPELCPRYTARIAKDIVIKDSPWWLQRRLMFAGMRPINNIVDITNYVMIEYGQPIHAFDIRQVEDGIIKVALAPKGGKFTTLDGNERELDGTMLTINDNNKPIALAGVMGGLNSEIESDTQEILVESANFNADSIRKTSKKLGIRSEASSRYEKGVSAELASTAADRVCSLIAQTGRGTVLSGIVDNYPGKSEMPIIKVRPARINKVLGTDLSAEQMKGILESLEIEVAVDTVSGAAADVTFDARPPHIRLDLKEEVDFVEEIGRLFGYNNLDVSIHKDSEESGVPRNWARRSKVREILTALGFSEIQTYSFTSPTAAAKSGVPEGSPLLNQVTLINPLGEENSVMRTSLLPEILEISAGNLNKGNEEGKLFELGNTFQAQDGVIAGSTRNPVPDGKPDERMSLSISAFGKDTDFYLIKGVIEELLARLGYVSITFEATEDIPSYHPGRCASVKALGRNSESEILLGYFGELHPDVKANYGIDADVYAGEFDLDAICNNAELMREYFPLGRFPASTIDLAFVADEDVQVGDIEKSISSINSDLLTSVSLFDVYRGKQLGEGKKSLAFNLTFRAEDRTLTDDEVNTLVTKIIAAVTENTGATLREV